MEKIERVIFYTLDKAIKTYRQFAQKRMNEAGVDITIDQWLVLNAIESRPEITQAEMAEQVFKDAASVTRIIELLIKKGYLLRKAHDTDRRRFLLKLSGEGNTLVKEVNKIAEQNREMALNGISEKELQALRNTLTTIINNCN